MTMGSTQMYDSGQLNAKLVRQAISLHFLDKMTPWPTRYLAGRVDRSYRYSVKRSRSILCFSKQVIGQDGDQASADACVIDHLHWRIELRCFSQSMSERPASYYSSKRSGQRLRIDRPIFENSESESSHRWFSCRCGDRSNHRMYPVATLRIFKR